MVPGEGVRSMLRVGVWVALVESVGVLSRLRVGVPVPLHEMERVNTWLPLKLDEGVLVRVDWVTPDGPRVGLTVVLCELEGVKERVGVCV